MAIGQAAHELSAGTDDVHAYRLRLDASSWARRSLAMGCSRPTARQNLLLVVHLIIWLKLST